MRFKARSCIKENDILAKPIFTPSGEVLLQDGIAMKPAYIERLEKLGIAGAYIEDEISKDIEVTQAISQEVRMVAMKNLESTFTINKDTAPKEVLRRSEALKKTAASIVDQILGQGDIMLNLADMKNYDNYTFQHSISVAMLAVVVGIGMFYDKNALTEIAFSGLLHDIGKLFIPEEVITKPGKLTDEEYAQVKTHSKVGYDYLMGNFYNSVSIVAARGVLDHHERVDGSGYPSGRKTKDITEFGRILAVCDVYDALVSDRPYRAGWTTPDAMAYIRKHAGTMFDADIVSVFIKKICIYPVGCCVQLSNNLVGIIMENNKDNIYRPIVRVFQKDGAQINPFVVNLEKEAASMNIVSLVKM